MTEATPTPAEASYSSALANAQSAMLEAVSAALREAAYKAAAGFRASSLDGSPPPDKYFAAVVHQAMYCLLCDADPSTFSGGNPQAALTIIENSKNIARHYWGAKV